MSALRAVGLAVCAVLIALAALAVGRIILQVLNMVR